MPNCFSLYRFASQLGKSLRAYTALLPLMTVLSIVSACTSTPKQEAPKQVETPAPTKPVTVDNRPFDTESLYALLVAEVAGDRQRYDVMLSNYVQQAETTLDPGVIERAARLARYLNDHNTSLNMAQLWLKSAPEMPEAHFIALTELINTNRLVEAVPHAEFLQAHGEVSGLDAIGARAQQGGDVEVSRQLIPLYEPLLVRYPNDAALNMGASLLYQNVGDLERALKCAQTAKTKTPDDFQAAAQEARILQQMGRSQEAMEKFKTLVESHPENSYLRLQYARGLLKSDLDQAQMQFAALVKSSPTDQDLLITLALIEFELGQYDSAKPRFTQLIDSQSDKHRSTSHYYLGRIAVLQKDDNGAIDHLSHVQPGTDYLPAQAQVAEILVARGDVQRALNLAIGQRQKMSADHPEMIEGLYLLEAHLLTTTGKLDKAVETLSGALTRFPKSNKLMFTRAMAFASLDKLDLAEADFKGVLASAPANAAALNAWGYTLADRTNRLDEAYDLISKAYAISPEDPAVMDSMGWVEYRRGNLDSALSKLKQAMKTMPDQEIAAHLGEVLWMSGQREEAKKVWDQGLQLDPKSQLIPSTIKRLNANH